MMMKCASIALSLIVLCVSGYAKPSPTAEAEKAALKSAQAWLALLDSAGYGRSWEGTAASFKSVVCKADWERSAQAARAPFGKMVCRKVKSRQYTTSLPGVPSGKYVVIQFDTIFANKVEAVETVTPMRDKDGHWRVSGYYIKPATNAAIETTAVGAAQAWLALVDRGSYAKSWDDAADTFKSAITQAAWEGAARGAREPLGKLISRTVKSRQYATQLPGAPKGEYVVIQFDTTFANKAEAVETVTPMRDKDGRWKVSGYYIK
jgi:hypothetical protein